MASQPQAEPLESLAQLAKAVSDFQQGLQCWLEQNGEALASFVQRLAEGLAAFDKYRTEQEAEDFAALAQGGWIGLERHFTYQQIRAAATICRSSGINEMNDAMLHYFSNNDFASLKRITNGWATIPYFRDRQAIIQDAMNAHCTGQFTLSIPAVLPLAEGLAAETLGTTSTRAIQNAAEVWKAEEAEAWSLEFWNVVNQVIYKRYDFGKDTATYLNRHGILHGRVSNYANAFNSTRVFLLVDVIADLWRRNQKPAQLNTP